MHHCSRLLALVAVVSLVAVGATQVLAEKILEPRALAMGSAGTALDGGLSAIQSNPATTGLLSQRGLEVGGLVGHDRLNAAFGAYSMLATEETGGSAIGVWRLDDSVSGGESQAISFATTYPVTPQTLFGVTLRHWRFSGIGPSTSKFDGDVGVVVNMNPEVGDQFVVIAIRNISKPHSFSGQRIARRLAIGGTYRSPEGILFALDFDDVLGDAPDSALRVGAEKMLTDRIAGRLGFNDGDFTVGLGVQACKYSVDYAFQEGDAGFEDYHLLGALFAF